MRGAVSWRQVLAWLVKHLDDGPPAAAAFAIGFAATLFVIWASHRMLTGDELTTGGNITAFAIGAWVGAECMLRRMGWLGRKFRPRLWIWSALTLGPWLLAVVAVIAANWQNFIDVRQLVDALLRANGTTLRAANILSTFFADGYSDIKSASFFRAWLALWVLAALLKLVHVTNSPARWTDFRKFTWLVLCVITVAGYPLATGLYTATEQLPAVWWVIALRLALPPFLLPLGGLLTLLLLGLAASVAVGLVFFLLISLPLHIYDWLRAREIQLVERAYKKRDLARYLTRLHLWLRHEPPPEIPDDSKGSRFAAPPEIEKVRGAWDDAVHRLTWMAFGHVNGWPLLLETDKHVLVQASTRSGKGVTIIIPHLLRYAGSAFVLDPKGENARATGRRRAELNGRVHYLDPFGISGKPRSRFNPLSRFTRENMEAESKALAAALFVAVDRDHWTASGQQLLAAVILHVFTSPAYPRDKKDLVTVRRILLGSIEVTLKAMQRSDAADGLVADLAASFLNTPERELGSIISTAQRETEILDNPFIASCLAAAGGGPEVDFSAWHTGTMTVFLCLSAPKFPVFNRWLRLVLTAALDEMTDKLTPPRMPVCFMLDELATLGHLGVVENAVGLAAGYGVQLVMVFQDVAQMRDLYRGRWASFIGNAGVRALFSLDDYDTAKYWSDFIGGRLTETLSQAQNIYGITEKQTAGEVVRPLLTPEEIMLRYAAGRMLVLKQGARPIEAERVAYFDDRSLEGLWDDPRLAPTAPAPKMAS